MLPLGIKKCNIAFYIFVIRFFTNMIYSPIMSEKKETGINLSLPNEQSFKQFWQFHFLIIHRFSFSYRQMLVV